eukprot:TRINITY_DN1061_c0_g1_i1.p1 TRINITY_DN1061_c0_g1~~TRINITY_DN1061_c0_g1_i1.p1  ORF type:complete len:400 (+),score=113.34 TRINITY_DN1061_c0_g1_i1:652-1851(+)
MKVKRTPVRSFRAASAVSARAPPAFPGTPHGLPLPQVAPLVLKWDYETNPFDLKRKRSLTVEENSDDESGEYRYKVFDRDSYMTRRSRATGVSAGDAAASDGEGTDASIGLKRRSSSSSHVPGHRGLVKKRRKVNHSTTSSTQPRSQPLRARVVKDPPAGTECFIGSHVNRFLGLNRGALYPRYPQLWARSATLDEKRILTQMGAIDNSRLRASIVRADQVRDIVRSDYPHLVGKVDAVLARFTLPLLTPAPEVSDASSEDEEEVERVADDGDKAVTASPVTTATTTSPTTPTASSVSEAAVVPATPTILPVKKTVSLSRDTEDYASEESDSLALQYDGVTRKRALHHTKSLHRNNSIDESIESADYHDTVDRDDAGALAAVVAAAAREAAQVTPHASR